MNVFLSAVLLSLALCAPSFAFSEAPRAAAGEGTSFRSIRKALDFYDDQGFLLLGKFEKSQWPATIVSEKEADDEIGFSLKSGTPHTYAGFFGYRLKVVIFEDSAHEETVLVFRSKTKKGVSTMSVSSARPGSLHTGISRIAKQLSEQDQDGPRRRIAVVDFCDVNGQIPPSGAVIAELLIGELFKTGRYEIVERKLLSSVLEQHKLNMTGLVNESTARKVGRLLGVDYIVTGTVIALGTTMSVNARTIAIETGSIVAAASADLDQDAFRQLPQKAMEPDRTAQSPAPAYMPPATGSFTSWMGEKEFGAEMDRLWKEGYFPAVVEGRPGSPANEYRAVMQPFPKQAFLFYWWYNQIGSQYEEHRRQMTKDGFREISLQTFTDRDGMRRYQTCWLKISP